MEKFLYEHLVNYDPGPGFSRDLIIDVQSNQDMWKKDIEHLRDHLNINRSSKNDVLNLQENRYYEAAKTLIDILDLTRDTGLVGRLIDVNLYIDMNGFPHAALVANMEISTLEDKPEHYLKLELIYTNAGQKSTYGAYMVIINVTDEFGAISVRSTLGDTNMADLVGTFQQPAATMYMQTSEDLCYPCDVVLKYNHNFPTPSVFVMKLGQKILEGITNVEDVAKSLKEESEKERSKK